MELIWGDWLTAITKIDFTPRALRDPTLHPCRAPEARSWYGDSIWTRWRFMGHCATPGDTPLFYWHSLPTIILLRARPYSIAGELFHATSLDCRYRPLLIIRTQFAPWWSIDGVLHIFVHFYAFRLLKTSTRREIFFFKVMSLFSKGFAGLIFLRTHEYNLNVLNIRSGIASWVSTN